MLCASESQDLEIVNFENFKSIYKFDFKSRYGVPRSGTVAALKNEKVL